jgi:hypothetical protein
MLTARALVLSLFQALSPGAERSVDARVVDAIAEASLGADNEEVALLATYAWLESGGQVNPRPYSWDAMAGISCGPWQMRCVVVRKLSLAGQARAWLRELRVSGLASVDSSPHRAERRREMALQALAVAMPDDAY